MISILNKLRGRIFGTSNVSEMNIKPDPLNVCDPTNGLKMCGFIIPEEVLVEVLSYVEPETLKNFRLVCRRWQELIDSRVWKLKVNRRHTRSLSTFSKQERAKMRLPWEMYYIICMYDPFNRNIMKNNCGQEQSNHWRVLYGGFGNADTGWFVEDVPVGSDPLPDHPDFEGQTCCFVTSYSSCIKEQHINLTENGLPGNMLDVYQPKIVASEWFAGRYDCGCVYNLTVLLVDVNGECVLSRIINEEVAQWAGRDWNKVEVDFENYGTNVRKVIFRHCGKDSQFWNGHYGSKMSGAVVKVLFPTNALIHSDVTDDLEADI